MYRLKVPFKREYLFLFIFCFAFSFLLIGCGSDSGESSDSGVESEESGVLRDLEIAVYQRDLLETGYEIASSIPVNPHIKDRSRAQEKVVLACLELDQPLLAERFTKGIADWRMGSCLGDLAIYCAKNGFDKEARGYIALAEKSAGIEGLKEWRSDRIKVKALKAKVLLGDEIKSGDLDAGLEDSETGKLSGAEALVAEDNEFKEQVSYLESVRVTGVYDAIVNSLQSYVNLYDRFYFDQEKRALIESNVKSGFGKLPGFIQVEILLGLSEVCVKHGDSVEGVSFVEEADEFVRAGRWPLENLVTVKADIAEGYRVCGQNDKARHQLEEALDMFNSGRGRIIDIYRAETLCPVGEVYSNLGDREVSLLVYYQAVEESIENRNSKPRAEDLSLICSSMALSALEPDAELWGRIKELKGSLGAPW